MKKIHSIAYIFFVTTVAGCGGGGNDGVSLANPGSAGAISSGPQNDSNASEASAKKSIAYLGDINSYSQEFKKSLGKDTIPGYAPNDADVIVLKIDATAEQAATAYAANSRGVPVVVYGHQLAPSQEFLEKFTAWPNSYAAVKLGRDLSSSTTAYDGDELDRLSKDLNNGFSDFKIPRRKPEITSSTISGQDILTWSDTIVFRRALRDPANSNDWLNASVKIIGLKDSKESNCRAHWTASIQGVGFMGKPLFDYRYTPGENGQIKKAAVSAWYVTMPNSYQTKISLQKGTSFKAPVIESYSPSNAVTTGSISTATGWKVDAGATFTASPKDVSGSLTATGGYSSVETRTTPISDAVLTTLPTTNDREQTIVWKLKNETFNSYKFSEHGVRAFISSGTSGNDSNMLLTDFDKIAPVMQAYSPMYNVLYVIEDSERNNSHVLSVDFTETQWKFSLERNISSWGKGARAEESPSDTFNQKITVANCFKAN